MIKDIPFFDSYDTVSRKLVLREATHFPEALFDYQDQIEILDLAGCRLEQLPSDFPRLKRLRTAFFSRNPFDQVPPVLSECENLEIIGFKSCGIRHIPEGALPRNLRWLILTDNKLQKLPQSLGGLERLQKLALAGNLLEELPENLSHCLNLELLRLGANNLSVSAPEWLLSLPRLAWFCDSGNPSVKNFMPELTITQIARDDVESGSRIGGSPTSDVFSGRLTSTGELVAIKTYKGKLTSDGYVVDDQIASIAVGKHPGLLEVLGRIPAGGGVQESLVLKLVPAGFGPLGLPPTFDTCTRDTFVEGRSFSLPYIIRVLTDISAALLHMHQRCMTHGDLYAHNILSNADGESLLGDFGAASFFSRTDRGRRPVEVRAFGCLMDDLLMRLSNDSAGPKADRLRELRDACLALDTVSRPEVPEIIACIKNLS